MEPSLSENTNREVTGAITLDNQFLITQVLTETGGTFNGLIRHDNILYYYYPVDQNPYPPFPGTIVSMIYGANHYCIPIKATVHSHTPCLQDNTNGVSHPVGNDDIDLATKYPMATHWVIGCNAIGNFDKDNSNFFNVKSGSLSSTCKDM